MMRAPLVVVGLSVALLPGVLVLGCAPPEASAAVVLEGLGKTTVRSLTDPRVELEVLDEQGRSARGRVVVDGEERSVTSPIPVRCVDGSCDAQLALAAGSYRFALYVYATDRCATEALVIKLSSGDELVGFVPGENKPVAMTAAEYGFDDDDDGMENVLELAVCARVDVPDQTWAPPAGCAAESPCCPDAGDDGERLFLASDLVGRAAFFDGSGPHARADGSTAEVEPFFLDATEVAWGTLERCVAAGACIYGKPGHPARVALDDDELRRDEPVVGLSPLEADELCSFLGKRLPSDDEWDYAAAYRAPGVRARYPWDEGGVLALFNDGRAPLSERTVIDDGMLGCWPEDFAPSANHRASGRGCPRAAQRVGQYGSTFARRAGAIPLADLAGNVWEWTVERGDPTSPDERLPADVRQAFLRGGNYDSPPQLLENDLRLAVRPEDLERLTPVAGVRCARSLGDDDAATVAAALLPPLEPPCGE